jgi:GalNAc-alpha-(1->4)-GalNAc-alpha-(1->3)-diNAcBac-PP-undecaprenol alpha-1,4-N-acetyl-D-galactosaminyltransferase
MEEKRKILIVSPSLKMGGIERALSVLANYFAGKGHNVIFISCQNSDKFYELNSNIIFEEPKFGRGAGKFIFYLRLIIFLRRIFTKYKPEVIMSFGDLFNPIVLLANIGLKVPVVISDTTTPDFNYGFLTRVGKNILYPRAAGFIAQTEFAANYNRRKFNNRLNIRVIPNAIKEVKRYDIPKNSWIVTVGRLSIEKGQDRLVEAFSKVVNKGDWKLVFAGDGPMHNELKQSVHDFGLDESVIFLGQVKNVDMLLSESKVFALPSRLEGYPNALCEAMASGLPCLVFASFPHDEIFKNNEEGIAVANGDIEGFSKALELLINDKNLRDFLGNNALNITQRLNIEIMGDVYFQFLLSTMK